MTAVFHKNAEFGAGTEQGKVENTKLSFSMINGHPLMAQKEKYVPQEWENRPRSSSRKESDFHPNLTNLWDTEAEQSLSASDLNVQKAPDLFSMQNMEQVHVKMYNIYYLGIRL